MIHIHAGVVDVHVIHDRGAEGWRVLVLRRSNVTRCPGAWETVHGRTEPGERPEHAAVRELLEETGLRATRLYNVTVHPFYLHSTGTVQLAIVFAAFVDDTGVSTGDEHDAHEWVDINTAMMRLAWPRERSTLAEAVALLRAGDAGAVEDVLRVF